MKQPSDLDAAVLAYIGKGRGSFPMHDKDAARATGGVEGDRLLIEIENLVDESMGIEVDWSSTSLGDAGRIVARVMSERHPELGSAALDALAWNFTYAMR